MAKAPNTAIGIDLGRSVFKSVVLHRSGSGRLALTHFATRPAPVGGITDPQFASAVNSLLKEMGGSAKACGASVSSPDAIIRIIDQPETPPVILRDALRLNGMTLLNQDCRQFVLDCDQIPISGPSLGSGQQRYLVGGLPRPQVLAVQNVVGGAVKNFDIFQLSSISLFNGFEFCHPEIFNNSGFFLVDIGATTTTMILGAKRELVLVRSIDIGGKTILEALEALSGEPLESVLVALQQEDEMMIENARVALMNLSREIGSSIGFFEGRREESIAKIHVCGATAKSRSLIRVLSEEVHIPCESWNPLATCEISVSSNKRDELVDKSLDLHVAFGVAAEILNS